MKKILCPSMMCANLECIKEEVKKIDLAGYDIFHCDIMDGNYVPNMALSPYDVACIRANTKKFVDAHLMVTNPDLISSLFIKIGVDIIYFHPETSLNAKNLIERIKSSGIHPGLAINPEVSIESIASLLPLVDYLLVMSVKPGFAGQTFIEEITKKIKLLVDLKRKYNYIIIIDGGITDKKIHELSKLGVDGFVMGTSALFGKGDYTTVYSHIHAMD